MGIVTFTYIFLINRYKYWKNKNVYTPDFKVPFGHAGEMVKGKQQIGILFSNVYKETKKHPYVGLYMIHRPYFVVNDLEIIKKILVSDFLHFNHHGFQYDEDKEPIDGHLFNATGDMWKYLRTKLTPTFTSNKMKLMFETLKDCNSQMLIYLENNVKKENEIELKELFSKLNTDVIGNCAFGIECNSFTDPDSEFRKMGRKIFEPNILSGIVRSLNFLIYCKFTTWLKQFVDKFEIQNFFYNLVNNTIKYREENNIYRKDFLQLLIELQQKGSVNDETTGTNYYYKN